MALLGGMQQQAFAAAAPDRCHSDPRCRADSEQAERLAAQKNYAEALSLYEQAQKQIAEPRLLLNIGRCHHRLGHPRQALLLYEQFQKSELAKDPQLGELVTRFIAEAKEALAADLQPNATDAQAKSLCDAQCLVEAERAEQLVEQRRYDEANAIYEQQYKRVGEPRLLVNLGRCHYRLGRPRQAMEYYRRFEQSPLGKSPQLAAHVEHFIAEAKEAIAAEAKLAPRSPATIREVEVEETLPRPRWRLATGAVALGVGATLIGLGAGALSVDGRCVEPSPKDPALCATQPGADGMLAAKVVDGVTPGAALLVSGGVVLIGGIVLIAIPGPRVKHLMQR